MDIWMQRFSKFAQSLWCPDLSPRSQMSSTRWALHCFSWSDLCVRMVFADMKDWALQDAP
jgi:hypothetical protein